MASQRRPALVVNIAQPPPFLLRVLSIFQVLFQCLDTMLAVHQLDRLGIHTLPVQKRWPRIGRALLPIGTSIPLTLEFGNHAVKVFGAACHTKCVGEVSAAQVMVK